METPKIIITILYLKSCICCYFVNKIKNLFNFAKQKNKQSLSMNKQRQELTEKISLEDFLL